MIPVPMPAALSRPTLAPRDRRAIRLGALVAAPMLLWTLGVTPYRQALADATHRRDAERALLDGERRLLVAAPLLAPAVDTGRARLAGAAAQLFAGAAGEAGAALVGYVREMAEEEMVEVSQVEPRPAREVGTGMTAVAIDVRGRTDLVNLLLLLRALEEGDRLVRVDSLEIRTGDAPDGAAAPFTAPADATWDDDATIEEPGALTFRFVVTGFALSDSLARALPRASDAIIASDR